MGTYIYSQPLWRRLAILGCGPAFLLFASMTSESAFTKNAVAPRTQAPPAICSAATPATMTTAHGPITALPPPDKRFAIVIGIGRYQDTANITRLDGPEHDVPRIEEALRINMGIPPTHITVLSSAALSPDKLPDKGNINDAIERLVGRVEGGLLVVVFSGHGFFYENTPFILTWEARGKTDSKLVEFATKVSWLTKQIQDLHPAQVMLFVDACQDYPLATVRKDNTMTAQFSDAFRQTRDQVAASYVMFATSPGQRSYINDDHLGYFIDAVAAGLNGAPKHPGDDIKMHDLVKYVEAVVPPRVSSERQQTQCPVDYIQGYEQTLFVITDHSPAIDPNSKLRRIRFVHARSDDACAELPWGSEIRIKIGSNPSFLASLDEACVADFRIMPSQIGESATVRLTHSAPYDLYLSATGYATSDTEWKVPVVPKPNAIRISAKLAPDHSPQKIVQLLRQGIDIVVARLNHSNNGPDYVSALAIVPTGSDTHALTPSDRESYLDDTNSLQLTIDEGLHGSSVSLVFVNRTAKPNAAPRVIHADLNLDDARYAANLYSAILLGALAEDAYRTAKPQYIRRILTDEALNFLAGLSSASPELLSLQADLQNLLAAQP